MNSLEQHKTKLKEASGAFYGIIVFWLFEIYNILDKKRLLKAIKVCKYSIV